MSKKTKIILIIFAVFFMFLLFLKKKPASEIKNYQIFIPNPVVLPSKVYSEKTIGFIKTSKNVLPENFNYLKNNLAISLSKNQKNLFLKNGSLILPYGDFDTFESFYQFLNEKKIPTYISSDYILHNFQIINSEILENVEIERISPLMKKLLEALYNKIYNNWLYFKKQKNHKYENLSKQTLKYLSIPISLIDPDFQIDKKIASEISSDLSKIKSAKRGVYLVDIFSQNCPSFCKDYFVDEDGKRKKILSGKLVIWQKKKMDSLEFYKKVCSKTCYFEDFSNYQVPGFYNLSDSLRRYYKAKRFLERFSFNLRNDDLLRESIYLLLELEQTSFYHQGSEMRAIDAWKDIYSTLSFFDGAGGINFYDFANILNDYFQRNEIQNPDQLDLFSLNLNEFRTNLGKEKGTEIFNVFKQEVNKELSERNIGLTFLSKKRSLSKEIFENLVFDSVGCNPKSPYFNQARLFSDFEKSVSCQEMEQDLLKKNWKKEDYWRKICESSLSIYKDHLNIFYPLCKVLPTNLEVLSVLGSEESEDILTSDYKFNNFCSFGEKLNSLESEIKNKNINFWLQDYENFRDWLIISYFKNNLKNNLVFNQKKINSSLAFLSEKIIKDPIWKLETYEEKKQENEGKKNKIYQVSFLEPEYAIYSKISYYFNFLEQLLKENGFLTGRLYYNIDKLSEIFNKLEEISDKEIKKETLSLDDKKYLEDLPEKFQEVIEGLASVYVEQERGYSEKNIKKIYFLGKDNALSTIFLKNIWLEKNTNKNLFSASGKLDLFLTSFYYNGKVFGFAGPVFSYYEFLWPADDILTKDKWKNIVLKLIERPIWYSRVGIQSSQNPYIIK